MRLSWIAQLVLCCVAGLLPAQLIAQPTQPSSSSADASIADHASTRPTVAPATTSAAQTPKGLSLVVEPIGSTRLGPLTVRCILVNNGPTLRFWDADDDRLLHLSMQDANGARVPTTIAYQNHFGAPQNHILGGMLLSGEHATREYDLMRWFQLEYEKPYKLVVTFSTVRASAHAELDLVTPSQPLNNRGPSTNSASTVAPDGSVRLTVQRADPNNPHDLYIRCTIVNEGSTPLSYLASKPRWPFRLVVRDLEDGAMSDVPSFEAPRADVGPPLPYELAPGAHVSQVRNLVRSFHLKPGHRYHLSVSIPVQRASELTEVRGELEIRSPEANAGN